MSGHSKWANIKNRKGKQDAAKGKVFTKMAKYIAVAAREGGSDPEMNAKLRDAVAKAKAASTMTIIIRAVVMVVKTTVFNRYRPSGTAVKASA